MSKNNKHLLVLSFTIFSLLLSGCSLLMPTRRSNSSSQEDSVSSRIDFTSSNYSASSNGKTSSSNYSASSNENKSSSSNSSEFVYSSYIPSTSINYDNIPTTTEDFVIENGVVTKYTGSEKIIKVPEVWNGEPVTTIGSFAFSNCSSLVVVAFPNTITTVEYGIFRYCSSLVSFNIPASLVNLGDDLIGGCYSLTSIDVDENNPYFSSFEGTVFNKDKTEILICPAGRTGNYVIPNGVEKIGRWAFCTCDNLTNIVIPNTVTTIENHAFYMCTKIVSFTIPNSVTNIEECVFSHCYALESITIPSSVVSIGNQVFLNCRSLSSINVDSANQHYFAQDNVLLTKDKSILLVCVMAKEGAYTIPEGVIEISQCAFDGCRLITEINMPSTLKTIGAWAFTSCSKLNSFNVNGNNSFICSKDGVVFNKNMTNLIVFPGAKSGDYIVPDGVKEISDMAFQYCSNITSVILPDGLTKIGQYSFNGCNSLSWMVLPNSIVSIRHDAFTGGINTNLFYKGTESQWSNIEFESNIDDVIKSTVYYYSETRPTESGYYWHYANGVPTIW